MSTSTEQNMAIAVSVTNPPKTGAVISHQPPKLCVLRAPGVEPGLPKKLDPKSKRQDRTGEAQKAFDVVMRRLALNLDGPGRTQKTQAPSQIRHTVSAPRGVLS